MEPKNLKRQSHPDRITLSPEALSRVNGWVDYFNGKSRAVKVTRNDIVNFLLLNRAVELSEPEQSELERLHFDEVKFATWALNTIREAKARGETLTLESLVKSTRKQRA